ESRPRRSFADRRRRIGCGEVHGKDDVENRPLAELTLDPYTSTEEFRQAFAERQTEADPLHATLDSGIDLYEITKQRAQMLSRDADAGIRDREFHPAGIVALR